MENIFSTALTTIPPHLILLFMIFTSIAVTIVGTIFLVLKFQNNKPEKYVKDHDNCLVRLDGFKEVNEKLNALHKDVAEILLRLKIEREG